MDSETTEDRMSYTWSEGPLSSFYLGVTVTIDHMIKSNIKNVGSVRLPQGSHTEARKRWNLKQINSVSHKFFPSVRVPTLPETDSETKYLFCGDFVILPIQT